MVITGLVAFIWVYFGRLYLIHDPDEWRIANQQLWFQTGWILAAASVEICGHNQAGLGAGIANEADAPRFQMGVFVAPGATTFTRILRGARSAAMDRAIEMSPPFVAA